MYQEAIKRGSVAVVTGAANGVGKVAATRFAEAGLSVVTAETDVRRPPLTALMRSPTYPKQRSRRVRSPS